MGIVALISNLLRLGCLFLEWKIASMPEEANRYVDETEDQINRLRATGKPDDAIAADRLRDRLLRRRGFASTISAASSSLKSQPTNSDSGRDIRPASG